MLLRLIIVIKMFSYDNWKLFIYKYCYCVRVFLMTIESYVLVSLCVSDKVFNTLLAIE